MMRRDFLRKSVVLPLYFPVSAYRQRHRKFLRSSNRRRRRFSRLPLLSLSNCPNLQAVRAEVSRDGSFPAAASAYGTFNGLSDSDLPVELSFTQALPPALTLEHAAEKIKEAVDKLKSNPPCSRSGILRIQVTVPPVLKALDWLLSQSHSSIGFPQFHFSLKDLEGPASKKSLGCRKHNISGFGSAVYFSGPFSRHSKLLSSIRRYLSVDSTPVTAFGFIDINYGMESPVIESETRAYFFIPQIQLEEFECTCMLSATLAWDDSSFYAFDESVQTLEQCLCQAVYLNFPSRQAFDDQWITDVFGKSELMDLQSARMVCLDAQSISCTDVEHKLMQPEGDSTCSQFYIRLTNAIGFTNDRISSTHDVSCRIQECANINAVWALLIIEECCRLGLTYFCIAPGSRSSPLAVAASAHPLATCVSCYDERSLAFHALGYGRGSHVPAVIITSSGTAVSNLFPAAI